MSNWQYSLYAYPVTGWLVNGARAAFHVGDEFEKFTLMIVWNDEETDFTE